MLCERGEEDKVGWREELRWGEEISSPPFPSSFFRERKSFGREKEARGEGWWVGVWVVEELGELEGTPGGESRMGSFFLAGGDSLKEGGGAGGGAKKGGGEGEW